jgi:transposase-like protein
MSQNEHDRTNKADPEVAPTAVRRQFSNAEKLRILEEADACTEPGEIGALLRREGIYSSYLSRWRKARDEGLLDDGQERKRGPKPAANKEIVEEVTELQRENRRLRRRLTRAEVIIEAQKKLSQILGVSLTEAESEELR